jgi:hypothetical protein
MANVTLKFEGTVDRVFDNTAIIFTSNETAEKIKKLAVGPTPLIFHREGLIIISTDIPLIVGNRYEFTCTLHKEWWDFVVTESKLLSV